MPSRSIPKIHYHSECPFFAGCENMLANFFNSNELTRQYQVTFSYAHSEEYIDGLLARVSVPPPLYPVVFAPPLRLWRISNPALAFITKAFLTGIGLLMAYPLMAFHAYTLYMLFKKLEPDIVHVNNGGYPGASSALAATIAAKLAGVPRVVMVVNNMALGYWHYSRLFDRPLDYLTARSTDIFITGSTVAGKRLSDVLRLSRDKLCQIYNGISRRQISSSRHETLSRFGLSKFQGTIFGVVSLLEPRKGHQVLLDAVLHLVSTRHFLDRPFHILIEGSGPLKKGLVKFVDKHQLCEYVSFVGVEKNIANFMNSIDALVLPSISHEDFPNVILEAMSLAKPVIASKIAGTSEQVLQHTTGFLVEPSNAYQLAEAILTLTFNPALRSEMGKAALLRYEANFTSDIAVSKYLDLYSAMLKSFHE
jgi:glycosyltransferase involved in cell wall biosynthesis